MRRSKRSSTSWEIFLPQAFHSYFDGGTSDGPRLSTPVGTPVGAIGAQTVAVERGFRVLKSEIEIGPVYHRLPARIRAHATICFMALILYRVMRMRLRASNTQLSPERALDRLRRIQHHQVIVNDTQPVAGLSTVNQEHTTILAALTIKKPT
jgi:hypothetical protein